MVEELASRWVDYVIENGADKEQRAVYVYGLICFINELFSSALLLAIALPLNRIWQIVVWMMAFDMLRLNIGGYHADTPVRCIVESAFIGILCTLAYPFLGKGSLFKCLIGAMCIIIVFRLSPVLLPIRAFDSFSYCRPPIHGQPACFILEPNFLNAVLHRYAWMTYILYYTHLNRV